MDNPRAEKVAVVDEVRSRLDGADATILTEYRGLTVAELAALRSALAAVGVDYKVYKNTLVKLAVAGGPHAALDPLLVGPTAIAFVSGEITAVAKALRDYGRVNPHLVVKGGILGDGVLSAGDLAALADLPSREVLLARIAGAIAAPLQQFAGLLQALPRNLAYGLSALVEERGELRLRGHRRAGGRDRRCARGHRRARVRAGGRDRRGAGGRGGRGGSSRRGRRFPPKPEATAPAEEDSRSPPPTRPPRPEPEFPRTTQFETRQGAQRRWLTRP